MSGLSGRECGRGWIWAFATAVFLAALPPAQGQSLLVDPCLGHRWMRVADPRHPAGPARLVEVGPEANAPNAARVLASRTIATAGPGNSPPDQRLRPGVRPPQAVPAFVIHSGERVMVEQATAQIRARFAAVALESAAAGAPLRVRLMAGANGQTGVLGPVVSVVAVGSGEARWPEREGREP